MTKRVYLYKRFNRIWHWSQALLIGILGLTGFEIHGSYKLLGFEKAVHLHNFASVALIILIAFAIFWHITTGEWKHYVPTRKNLLAQIRYYLIGIFKGDPHPFKKKELSKLNPLQILVYLKLKILLIPILVVTGLLYHSYSGIFIDIGTHLNAKQLHWIANLHTLASYLVFIFILIHVYMTTTGHTPTSNLKAMITGWEEIEDEQKER